jgi:hypothetical protein
MHLHIHLGPRKHANLQARFIIDLQILSCSSVPSSMMLLLTPIGLGDPCIEGMPNLEDAVPKKSEVTVLVCMDGKNDVNHKERVNVPYVERLFLKLCKKGSRIVKTIKVMQISFFDQYDLFMAKLSLCDIFFMAGFTTQVRYVEAIYRRHDPDMARKRDEVAYRCIANNMLVWAVCGSAMSCGEQWDSGFSKRKMAVAEYQMFGILGDGNVDYDAFCGPKFTTNRDLTKWQITSGTGLFILVTLENQRAQAFCCVKKNNPNNSAYQEACKQMQPKLNDQVARLAGLETEYVDAHGRRWRLDWRSGRCLYVD